MGGKYFDQIRYTFNLPGKKKLHTLDKDAVVLIDVTENPIERPKKDNVNIILVRRKSIP